MFPRIRVNIATKSFWEISRQNKLSQCVPQAIPCQQTFRVTLTGKLFLIKVSVCVGKIWIKLILYQTMVFEGILFCEIFIMWLKPGGWNVYTAVFWCAPSARMKFCYKDKINLLNPLNHREIAGTCSIQILVTLLQMIAGWQLVMISLHEHCDLNKW